MDCVPTFAKTAKVGQPPVRNDTIRPVNAGEVQASVAWWETASVIATVAVAGFQIASWLFSLIAFYRKKRPHNQSLMHLDHKIGLEKTSLNLAGIAGLIALAGAFLIIGYTRANHKQQRMADLDNLEIHRQLTAAQQQLTSASQTASQAVSELTLTKGQLTAITKQLADADQQLADGRARLQRVESHEKWRILSPQKRKRMIAILSRWKGNGLAMNPGANDNEVYAFASELDSVFRKSGWQTAWASTMAFPMAPAILMQEGVNLQLPRNSSALQADIEKDLIEAVRIADPLAAITYMTGDEDPTHRVIHLLVGPKRQVATRSPR